MAAKAYILIEATIGRSRDVARAIQALRPAVAESYLITGPYDVVAIIAGKDADTISASVTELIHSIPGIARTVTCLAIPSGS